jgi:hypothetical protein
MPAYGKLLFRARVTILGLCRFGLIEKFGQFVRRGLSDRKTVAYYRLERQLRHARLLVGQTRTRIIPSFSSALVLTSNGFHRARTPHRIDEGGAC